MQGCRDAGMQGCRDRAVCVWRVHGVCVGTAWALNVRLQADMMRMVRMLPAVQKMLAPALRRAGFGPDELMSVAMQIQAFGGEDATIATDTAKLMKAVQGDLSDLL